MPSIHNGRYPNTLKGVRDVTAKRDKKKVKPLDHSISLRIYVIVENIFPSDTPQKCNSTDIQSLTIKISWASSLFGPIFSKIVKKNTHVHSKMI
jgi:hypothetical protein